MKIENNTIQFNIDTCVFVFLGLLCVVMFQQTFKVLGSPTTDNIVKILDQTE